MRRRICRGCDAWRGIAEFKLDGRSYSKCHRCRVYQRQWAKTHWNPTPEMRETARLRSKAWYGANKARALEVQRARRRADPAKFKAYRREYYAKHRERAIADSTRWHLENIERGREHKRRSSRRWRERNPEAVLLLKKSWKARKRAAGPLPMKVIRAAFAAFPMCAYCGKTRASTLDHLIPVSKGGTNDRQNLVAACVSCNSSKQDAAWKLWFRSKPFFSPARFRAIEVYLERIGCP